MCLCLIKIRNKLEDLFSSKVKIGKIILKVLNLFIQKMNTSMDKTWWCKKSRKLFRPLNLHSQLFWINRWVHHFWLKIIMAIINRIRIIRLKGVNRKKINTIKGTPSNSKKTFRKAILKNNSKTSQKLFCKTRLNKTLN